MYSRNCLQEGAVFEIHEKIRVSGLIKFQTKARKMIVAVMEGTKGYDYQYEVRRAEKYTIRMNCQNSNLDLH